MSPIEDIELLVYCANGLQGQAMTGQLTRAGVKVQALVRDATGASSLRRLGAAVVQGDFDDQERLRAAHRGVDAVLVQFPAGDDAATIRRRTGEAMAAIAAEDVGTVIANTSVNFPRAVGELPNFAAKLELQERVQRSGLRWAVLRPTGFLLENLLNPWAVQGIASQGTLAYPVAADLRFSWVAAGDVGRAAASVLRDDLYGQVIDLTGPVLDGQALAAAFTEALNRPVRFVSLPVDQFEQAAGAQVAAIFKFIERHPDDAFVRSASARQLGPDFRPTAAADWIREHRRQFSAP